MNDDELIESLGRALEVPVPAPPKDRIAQVRAAAERARDLASSGAAPAVAAPPPSPITGMTSRRALLLSTAAAAVGAVGGAVVANATQDDPPSADPGPPTEALSFMAGTGSVAGSTVEGRVINHTWGVEVLLDTTGLPVGERYDVIYIDVDGGSLAAGGFIGAELPIHCRCNAALLRDRIAAIEIHDAGAAVVSRADFA